MSWFKESDIVTAMLRYRLLLEADLDDELGLPGDKIEMEVGFVLYDLCELIGIKPAYAQIVAGNRIAKEVDGECAGFSYGDEKGGKSIGRGYFSGTWSHSEDGEKRGTVHFEHRPTE